MLTAAALAHQDAGQHIVVTSTAALAAQRLADELTTAGVHSQAHSTVALHHAIASGHVVLDPSTTLIHDEAALASTRELDQLLDNVEQAGARIILIGDPRQSHPVGAGGLWPHIQHAADRHDARQHLTDNVRAHDPADARDQNHFREGHHLDALTGYANRDRLTLHPAPQNAENAALEAADQDRRDGRRTVVITQTSNDHLDELNARAQALRHQAGELGRETIGLTGRPYELRRGDEIQLRASIPHPDGPLRNGTTATVTGISAANHTAGLRLSDERQVTLNRDQLDQAHVRLAYVQHPFPAQGTTTDTTHLIIGEHPTADGTYVGLTRARTSTHIYAATQTLDPSGDHLPQLAEHVSSSDPDLPSISLPLAHEHAIRRELDDAGQTTTPVQPDPLSHSTLALASDKHPMPLDERLNATRRSDDDGEPRGFPPAITTYRNRYEIPDTDLRPLGPEPPPHAFRQRLDRRHAANTALALLRDDSDDAAALRAQILEHNPDELERANRDADREV